MLHRKAGTRELVEVHGSIEHVVVPGLRRAPTRSTRSARGWPTTPIACPRCDCGAPLKPDVVLFGELLPEGALERAYALAAGADLLLCVGSSLEVHPVAQLPGVTRAARRRGRDRHAGPDAVGRARRGQARRRRRRRARGRARRALGRRGNRRVALQRQLGVLRAHRPAERVADDRDQHDDAERAERQRLVGALADAPLVLEVVRDPEQRLQRAGEDGHPAAQRRPRTS